MSSMSSFQRIRATCAVALALCVVAMPRFAEACAVCSPNRGDPAQYAFARASLFLSLLPLFMIGGLGWWIRRRARRIAADEAAGVIRLPGRHERPPVPESSPGLRSAPAPQPRKRARA